MLVGPEYPDEITGLKAFLRYVFLMRPYISEISPKKICLIPEIGSREAMFEGESEEHFAPLVAAADAYVLSTWRAFPEVIEEVKSRELALARPDFAIINAGGK